MATPKSDINYKYAAYVDINGNPASFGLGANADVLRVNSGNIAPGQTIQSMSSSGAYSIAAGTSTPVLRTVTPLKTYYITDIFISTDGGAILVQVKAGSAVIVEAYISTTAPLNMTGIESQDPIISGTAITIAYPTTASRNITYKIAGFEQ